jgi:hypothetical protein
LIYLVPVGLIDQIYPKVSDHLVKAINHNRISGWTVGSLFGACRAGQTFLWVDDMIEPKNAATAQFVNWGGEEKLYVMFMAGEGNLDWLGELEHFFQFAEKHGVTDVVANVRDGWLPRLPHKRLATLVRLIRTEK